MPCGALWLQSGAQAMTPLAAELRLSDGSSEENMARSRSPKGSKGGIEKSPELAGTFTARGLIYDRNCAQIGGNLALSRDLFPV